MSAIQFPLETVRHMKRAPSCNGTCVILDIVPRIEYINKLKENAKMAKRLPGIVISDPIPLTEFDESGDTWIKFQRPRRWEQEELDAMQAQSEIIFDTETRGQVRQRDRVPWSKLESEMVCMCLVESNLADEDGELLFIPGKNCRAARKDLTENVRKNFYKIWHGMDATVAGEVVTKLQEWHPPFDWRGGQGED